jgi:hypothetical protein
MVLKRKFSVLITLLICLFTLIGLTSCGNSSSTDNTPTQPEIILSEAESEVYNSIIKSLYSFKNPGSVTVVAVGDENFIGGRYVKISAQNGFGGYSTSIYQANPSGLREAEDATLYVDSSVNISNINKKLTEYKQSQGLA